MCVDTPILDTLRLSVTDRDGVSSPQMNYADLPVNDLAVSVAGHVGHVVAHAAAARPPPAVPPLAAAAALAVGMGVLKRVVASQKPAGAAQSAPADLAVVAADAESAARAALAASIAVPRPW